MAQECAGWRTAPWRRYNKLAIIALMAILGTGFWDANPLYNQFNFWFAVSGLALTLLGFGITITQLVLTKKAAEAAREATEKTREQLGSFAAFIDMKTLGEHAREVVMHLMNSNLQSVALRSVDLRDGVARARKSSRTRSLMQSTKWQETNEKIVLVHELAMTMITQGRDMNAAQTARGCRLINEVADLFHELSASMESKIEG